MASLLTEPRSTVALPLYSPLLTGENPHFYPESPKILAEFGPYQARLAQTENDRMAAYRLRFLVFNLEMNEGLESAFTTGLDSDRYDSVCDQLIVEEKATEAVIGTYRLQTGRSAALHFGYYSEQEFCFAPYERLRNSVIELGRACILKEHRSAEVLNLLWRGVMRYALANGGRYLIGCCSVTSQDAREGAGVFAALQNYMVEDSLVTSPTPAFALPVPEGEILSVPPPKLLRAYLAIGAKICSAPAIDREFRTIDLLTMIDLETLNPRIARRFL
jgi:putative hemolysin